MQPIIKLIIVKAVDSEIRESVAAEQVEENLFRLIESPLFSDYVTYGTTVRVSDDINGDLVVTEIVTPSSFVTTRLLLPKELQETKKLNEFAQPIVDAGGSWDSAMGGVLFIHLPKGSTFQIPSLFNDHK